MHYDGDGCKEVDMQSEHAIELAPGKASLRLRAAEKLAESAGYVLMEFTPERLDSVSRSNCGSLLVAAIAAWKDANK